MTKLDDVAILAAMQAVAAVLGPDDRFNPVTGQGPGPDSGMLRSICGAAIHAYLSAKPSQAQIQAAIIAIAGCFYGGSSGLDELAASIAEDHARAALLAARRAALEEIEREMGK